MRRPIITTALACLFVLPPALAAQEAEGQEAEEQEAPETLRLSFYKCDFNQFGPETQEELEDRVIPVWDELVDEGMVESAGYIFHSWADEWNVGIYTIGADIPAIIAAQDEAGRRLEERYPDAESSFAEACPEHRDGFYTFGPQTGEDDEEEDEAGGGS